MPWERDQEWEVNTEWELKWEVSEDRKGKGKGKGQGNGKGKGIIKQTPGGDDISRAVALQLQEEMYEADLDTEGELERVYWDPEVSPAVSIASDNETVSTKELGGKYDSEHDSNVDMHMADDVDALDGIDLDRNVDMERDGNDEEKEDDEEEDEKEEEDEDEEEEEEEEEEEDVDVDQQLLGESAGGDSIPNTPLPDIPLPNVPLPNVPRPEACPVGSVGEEWTSPRIAEEAMVVAFGLGWGYSHVRFLCSNEFNSGIDYYMRYEVFGFLRVYSLLFIVLWDIAHAVFLQLLACKTPPCDGVGLNKSLKLAEIIGSLHTRLLRPSANFHPFLHWKLHPSRVVENGREDPFPLPQIFMPKEVHLRQLAT